MTMNTILSKSTVDDFIERINKINDNMTPAWGKMTAYQMLKHCTESEKINLGITRYKRLFIGRLFGKMALKEIVKDNLPGKKNAMTHPALIIREHGNVALQKQELIALFEKYPEKSASDFKAIVHPFFGKMSFEHWNRFICKHMDHHLRQFNV